MRSLHHHHCDMGDSALPSGEYEFRLPVGTQKIKNEVRLFMSMMMNRCSSSKRRKTTSYDHGASSSFNENHEDLIWEILFRLPPKHVLQFKCVSKRWNSIISNPEFPRNHSLRYHSHFHQPSHEFLLLPQDDKKKVLLLNLLDHYSPDQQPLADLSVLPVTGIPVAEGPDFVFVDSCNGLILYAHAHNCIIGIRDHRCLSRSFSKDDDDDLYYLCNPVTKDYIKLPNLKHALVFEEDENKRVFYNNLDTRIFCDPSVSLSYKVIRFVCRSVRHPRIVSEYQFYIYSSESGSWRLSTSVASDFYFNTYHNVFLNGVMYWMTSGIDLLCFDAEKNSVWFQPLPLKPKPKFDYRHPFYFGKCGGRLYLIEKYSRNYWERGTLYDGFDILELTTDDTRWTKKYHVNLGVNHHHLVAADISILHIYKTRNQFKEEAALLMKIDGRIVSFSLKSNTFFGKELTIPNSKQPYSFGDIHPTFLTFVPL